jgi:hypothetical protein
MGKWNPGQHLEEREPGKRAELLLRDCIEAKNEHRASGYCQLLEGGSPDRNCCACHFWAGAIHALTEVLMQ